MLAFDSAITWLIHEEFLGEKIFLPRTVGGELKCSAQTTLLLQAK
jgi:hypothetical protein